MAADSENLRNFDFVVVGAGTSGCVLANRLTENPGFRVLLLEAGPEATSTWIKIPIAFPKLFIHPTLNWGFSTEPEPKFNNRSIYWPRGKVVGGCSAINGNTYMRGHAEDFNSWQRLGNPGWAWADVLPYFKKSERRRGHPADEYHSDKGLLSVSDPRYIHPSARAFIEAGLKLGLRANNDHNGAEQDGIGLIQYLIEKGVRHSAADAFLTPARKRPNLVVETSALAHRVVMDGRKATGVEYVQNGKKYRAMAAREVILAGGAINSPQLLLLSGIGPAKHLREKGIAVVADLPGVGENVQDHPYIHCTCRTAPDFSLNPQFRFPRVILHALNYYLRKQGPLTIGAASACAFVRGLPGAQRPDLQMFFRPLSHQYDENARISPDVIPRITATVCYLQPKSRGRLLLKSPDPEQAPLIYANYLTAEPDEQAMIVGVKWIQRIFRTEPLKSHIVSEDHPGESCKTDDDIRAVLASTGQTMCHPVGTCKMGPDAMGVVDERLRVRGVESLRVADASIMPIITSGNTAAACYLIGEKGADLIKADQ